MRGVWRFIKRQYNTKTGKGAMTTIAGSAAAVALGGAAASTVAVPVVLAVLAMFLRDTEAKKDERDGGE